MIKKETSASFFFASSDSEIMHMPLKRSNLRSKRRLLFIDVFILFL